MEISFDIRGNIKPYEILELSRSDFRANFIEPFDESNSRNKLYNNYLNYMENLQALVQYNFYQWIDGSFITNKLEPNDIDIVTILDYRDFEANKKLLESSYASFGAREKYGVDAYIVVNYPESHKKAFFTKSDLLYWRNLFGKTKVNRAKKQYEKGIIQLNYTQDGQ